MIKAKILKDKWCRCGNCGHKLFKVVVYGVAVATPPSIEVKCHSCKEINLCIIRSFDGV